MTRRFPITVFALMAATVVVGVTLDLTGTQLGVPHPPFIGKWWPRVHQLMLVAAPCFAAAVALVPRVLASRPPVLAAALFGGTLALRTLLAMGRGGPAKLEQMFYLDGEGKNEYLPSLAAFDYGPRFFIDRFAELVPALPVHSAGHPPGLLLVMHFLGLDTPARLAAFCLIAGAASAPLTYALARRVIDERAARVAGVLAAAAPVMLHYGATSADAVFLTVGLLAALGLVSKRPVVGAVALAAASLFAWSLLAVGAWAAVYTLAKHGLRPALRLALTIGVALLAFHAAFALATGFDPLGALHATSRVYEVGIASRRPYLFWFFGSPTAFLLILGVPITWLALQSRTPEAYAIAAVIVFSAVLGFTKAETERIWLFYAPFVILAAAPLVRRPTLVVGLLAVQAVVYEALFDTLW